MEQFWFYIKLGLDHVLDFSAYDHILFLAALGAPYTFKSWKKVLVLATVFTVAHCLSLAASVFEIFTIDSGLIEFLIPVTIFATAAYNIYKSWRSNEETKGVVPILATTFFGFVHGFGFSNYFKMLMSGEENKLGPLFGFATGIEISQVLIIMSVLCLAYLSQTVFKLKKQLFIIVLSLIIFGITIPMLVKTFPW